MHTSEGDFLNNLSVKLGGDHRGYGKVDLPKDNITWNSAFLQVIEPWSADYSQHYVIWHSLGFELRSQNSHIIRSRSHLRTLEGFFDSEYVFFF